MSGVDSDVKVVTITSITFCSWSFWHLGIRRSGGGFWKTPVAVEKLPETKIF